MNLDEAISTILEAEKDTVEALESDLQRQEVVKIRELSQNLERRGETPRRVPTNELWTTSEKPGF